MTAPLIPIRCTMPDGTTRVLNVVGMSVAAAEQPQAVALELVDGGPDWRRVGPGLLAAAQNAAAMLQVIYTMADRADATSISGIAACNTMLKSMEKNRARTQTLILDPINAAIAAAKGDGR